MVEQEKDEKECNLLQVMSGHNVHLVCNYAPWMDQLAVNGNN